MKKFSSLAFFCTLFLMSFCTLAQNSVGEAVPANTPISESIHFGVVIFYLPTPAKNPLEVVRQQAAQVSKELRIVAKQQKRPAHLEVSAYLEKEVAKNYPPPTLQSLQYFGRGLSREQAQAMQASRQALVLAFGHPGTRVWEGLRAANELTERVARETSGLIWDEETREAFTPDEWHQRRVTGWNDGYPDMTRQIVIHAYKDTDLVRAITLGMARVGLPDVLMEEFPWSVNQAVGSLINALCQTLAEGAAIKKNGELDLDLKALRHTGLRERLLKSLQENARSTAQLTLRQGRHDEGDPDNRLIRISAERYPGKDASAKQDKLLTTLFGGEDKVLAVRHNDAIRAASERARARLPELKRLFTAGLRPGELIMLKAPFAIPGEARQEWMWVEVGRWGNGVIDGLLKNEPANIPDLHAGQRVSIKEADVFDFIRQHPDGKREGNETGELIMKMQRPSK